MAASHKDQLRSVRLRVIELASWIDHWRDDVAAGLKPTEKSLEKAVTIYERALDECDALLEREPA